MTRRDLQLLGPVRVESNAGDVPRFGSQRTMALLGYPVAERRDALAALFWPDESQSKGRGSLRRELHNLSQNLPGCWDADRRSVKFTPTAVTHIDLYQFQEYQTAGQWPEAAELVRGDFLEGLYLADNLEFETWLLGERERWRQQAERLWRLIPKTVQAIVAHGPDLLDVFVAGQSLIARAELAAPSETDWVEMLRDLEERGDIVQDESGYWIEGSNLDWQRLPARIEAAIGERIARLPAELREALQIASVEGSFLRRKWWPGCKRLTNGRSSDS